jgi:hypothetical protein
MTEQRLTEQLKLVFTSAEDVQSSVVGGGAESVVATCEPERPAMADSLMEVVCERENLKKALRRVKANKGSPGIDGMTVEQLPDYLLLLFDPSGRSIVEVADGVRTMHAATLSVGEVAVLFERDRRLVLVTFAPDSLTKNREQQMDVPQLK